MTETETEPDIKPGRMWRFDARMALSIYKRLIAILLLAIGIFEWAEILGLDVPLPGAPFADLPLPLQAAAMVYAVVDLVAAVGLWLSTTWGTVIWLFGTLSRIILHTGLAGTFGGSPSATALQTASVIAFLVLIYLVEREEREEVADRRRKRRQQP